MAPPSVAMRWTGLLSGEGTEKFSATTNRDHRPRLSNNFAQENADDTLKKGA
jgi:hypothetical protein